MVAIIGAGISGLTLAYYFKKAGVDFILLEASEKPGGYISTFKKDNYLFEIGPNSLLCDEESLEFLKELDLENEIVFANQTNKKRFIFKNGKYRKLPDNP